MITNNWHISIHGGYVYKHLHFEWHNYCGPIFLRHKDSEPKNKQYRGGRDYAVLWKWQQLSKEDQAKYRVY